MVILRKVKVCGLTGDGKTLRCAQVEALLDPGSTMTVIRSNLARAIGGKMMPKRFHARIEGRRVPLKLTALALKAEGCNVAALAVAVDDALISRSGDKVDMILGHDYLQRNRAGLRYGEAPDEHEVACNVSGLRKKNGRSRRSA